MIIPPLSTIGIIGGGQLGRMLAVAAAQLGYSCHIYAPDERCPAADVAHAWTRAGYDDIAALRRFAETVDIVTYEFENIPAASVAALSSVGPIAPDPRALEIAQDRAAEKTFAEQNGARTAPWAIVESDADLEEAIGKIGLPAILKTRRDGYDGKGQVRLADESDIDAARSRIDGRSAILEGQVVFEREFSIIVACGSDGSHVAWDPIENIHVGGILDTSMLPAGSIIASQADEAKAVALRIAKSLDYVGVLTVEFFACPDGPLFNEMAPRVHNSGHWTIEGAATSQFENHIRAICGLPLGDTTVTADHIQMKNLIGHEVESWPAILADPTAHLHLYGKKVPRSGRKMGHVTRLRRR